MMAQLTFDEARARYAKFGQCTHDRDWETTAKIPGTNIVIKNCKVCGFEKERFFD